ncbi:hypothetical protein [Vibrio gallaecicus]|nr:hypothetical protein [Vibrio gallaecicus]MDN3617528.1 hypothetical protein [Vibrio gallaecicus]
MACRFLWLSISAISAVKCHVFKVLALFSRKARQCSWVLHFGFESGCLKV